MYIGWKYSFEYFDLLKLSKKQLIKIKGQVDDDQINDYIIGKWTDNYLMGYLNHITKVLNLRSKFLAT